MPRDSRRQALVDVVGLLALLLALADYLPPSLLGLETLTAGGDTPCHYPTAAFLVEKLLPAARLHGWYPGAYLGHPLLLYYFPLPFLLMAGLAPLVGLPVAFKLGSVGGVFLLPLAAWAALRLMGFRFPGPLLGAAASFVFLLVEENPIWGGSLASTLAGEFAYTYGAGLALVSLAVAYRSFAGGRGPWAPGLALALTALAHGYAVLWAGLSMSGLLLGERHPRRALRWLAAVAAIAFCAAAFFLLPLLAGWGWTTAYDDPWLETRFVNLLPPLLWPLLAPGVVLAAREAARLAAGEAADGRVLLVAHAALVGVALAVAAPGLGVIDVRLLPLAQLAVCLLGAVALGRLAAWGLGLVSGRPGAARRGALELAALGLVALAIVYADARTRVLRSWVEWNMSGLEAKELWPEWRRLNALLAGDVSSPRVAVEYSKLHERGGSIRVHEMLPFFSGRSTLEGVYNQAAVTTHPVYFLTSELSAVAPNPFRKLRYSRFDTGAALVHLRLLNVREVVALSDQLVASLRARREVELLAQVGPYHVFRLRTAGSGYVEPVAFAPVRSSRDGWREKAYRWWARQSPRAVPLVFTDDASLGPEERDPWLPPQELPLPADVSVRSHYTGEELTLETSHPGHPLLVKIAYHPRWRAIGADGPYLVAPGLMLVVPRQPQARLVYAARTAADWLGLGLTLATFALGAIAWARRLGPRVVRSEPPGETPSTVAAALADGRLETAAAPSGPALRQEPAARRGSGALLALALLPLLALPRLQTLGAAGRRATAAASLDAAASRAYSEGRFEDAAEYARHALERGDDSAVRAGLACLRGESLLRAGRAMDAALSFASAAAEPQGQAYQAQALAGQVLAWRAAGEPQRAEAPLRELLERHARTPWAERVR